MHTHLLNSHISAHHGAIDRENELVPTLQLLKSNPQIDMIEIDFVYDNGKFISSHDYDNDKIALGSEITEWFDKIIPLKKILWIDIKDSTWSIFSDTFSKFDINAFFELIRSEKQRFRSTGIALETYILIGCQYDHLIEQIAKLNNGEFMIAHDFPRANSYVARVIAPTCMNIAVDKYAQDNSELVIKDLGTAWNIVCLDMSFFTTDDDLFLLLNKIDTKCIIILYSLELDAQPNITVSNKHLIVQYNYPSNHQYDYPNNQRCDYMSNHQCDYLNNHQYDYPSNHQYDYPSNHQYDYPNNHRSKSVQNNQYI